MSEDNQEEMFKEFIDLMEKKYNNFKRGPIDSWKFCSIEHLNILFSNHINKYMNNFYNKVYKFGNFINDVSEVELSHLQMDVIDISNYCMMIFERFKELKRLKL